MALVGRGRLTRMMRHAPRILAVSLLMLSCARFEGAFSFLREPPVIERIPGVYTIHPRLYSRAMLKKKGYSDLSSTLTLHPDGTFAVSRLVDCCVYAEYDYFGGYFNGSGTWSVEKSQSVYDVRFKFKKLTREGSSDIKQPKLTDEMSFTLTKDSGDYGLAAPLFDGEYRYVYFKKTKPN